MCGEFLSRHVRTASHISCAHQTTARLLFFEWKAAKFPTFRFKFGHKTNRAVSCVRLQFKWSMMFNYQTKSAVVNKSDAGK